MPLKLKNKQTTWLIIGYGNFAKVWIHILTEHTDSKIVVLSRSPQSFSSSRIKLGDVSDISQADVIVPCVPPSVLPAMVSDYLQPKMHTQQLLLDISSIKLYPKQVLSDLKAQTQVVLSHPMFGPGTLMETQGKITGLTITTENMSASTQTYSNLMLFFKEILKLKVVEINAKDHDKRAAQFHFTTQYIGHLIQKLDLKASPIDTTSFTKLLELREMLKTDEWLLKEMYDYNPYVKKQLKKINQSQLQLMNAIT